MKNKIISNTVINDKIPMDNLKLKMKITKDRIELERKTNKIPVIGTGTVDTNS